MRISVVQHDFHRDYIRRSRAEILNGTVEDLPAQSIEPVPFAKYLFAYDDLHDAPIGFAESTMHHAVYESYEATPYSSLCELSTFCPFEQMAGIRTIYVEPKYRRASPAFLALAYYSAVYFLKLGATHSTATTNANDHYVNALYTRIGGHTIGTLRAEKMSSCLFVIDLEKMVASRVFQRAARGFQFDHDSQAAMA